MSHISYSESSSSSARSLDIHDFNHGFQHRCFCGGAVTFATKPNGTNIGRLCYKCQNDTAGGLHISKWWDAAMYEEIQALRNRVADQDDRISYLTQGPNGEHIQPRMMWAQLGHHTQSITTLTQKVQDMEELLEILRVRRQALVVRVIASTIFARASNMSVTVCFVVSVLAFLVALFK